MLSKQSVASATLLLTAFSILSKTVFFAQESVMASVFGVSQDVSAPGNGSSSAQQMEAGHHKVKE